MRLFWRDFLAIFEAGIKSMLSFMSGFNCRSFWRENGFLTLGNSAYWWRLVIVLSNQSITR